MTSETEIQHHFIDRFFETHGEAPAGFSSALTKRVPDRVTASILEWAAEAIIRNKRIKTFPSFADCLSAITNAKENPLRERGGDPVPSVAERFDPRWSEEAALCFCRSYLGRQAARDGWVGQLVDFVRVQKRFPDEREITVLQRKHREFEDAVAITAGSGFSGRWRPLGVAIMDRNARYERELLGAATDASFPPAEKRAAA